MATQKTQANLIAEAGKLYIYDPETLARIVEVFHAVGYDEALTVLKNLQPAYMRQMNSGALVKEKEVTDE